MSTTKTKSNVSSVVGGSNHLLQVPGTADSSNQSKPKRKAPARPSSADKSKARNTSSNKSNAKVKRNASLQEESSVSRNAKSKRKSTAIGAISPIKEERSTKGKRKTPTNSITEEHRESSKDSKLRRIVSPRKEQYSHLLDEMVGCGDMVLLEPLTEDNIIENLKKRYTAGDIYVSACCSVL